MHPYLRWRHVIALGIALMVPTAGGASDVEGLAEGVMAQLLKQKNPRYPRSLASKGQEGWVEVSFVIAPDGTTQDLLVEDSTGSGEFEKPSLDALKRWRYKPATLAGKPVHRRKDAQAHRRAHQAAQPTTLLQCCCSHLQASKICVRIAPAPELLSGR